MLVLVILLEECANHKGNSAVDTLTCVTVGNGRGGGGHSKYEVHTSGNPRLAPNDI